MFCRACHSATPVFLLRIEQGFSELKTAVTPVTTVLSDCIFNILCHSMSRLGTPLLYPRAVPSQFSRGWYGRTSPAGSLWVVAPGVASALFPS